MGVFIDLTIDMTSDWGVGSGTARHGSIDRCVRRDVDGLPYLPGRSLRGVLREACAQAAAALDDGKPGAWTDLWLQVFGQRKGGGRVIVPSARLSPEVRTRLLTHPGLAEATWFVRSSTAIDPASGVAKHDTLRVDERVRAGARLLSTLELDVDNEWWVGPESNGLHLLLLAGARLIWSVGGKRRRGVGRCEVTIRTGRTLASLLDESQPPAPCLLPPRVFATTDSEPATAAPDDQASWRRHVFTVDCLEPVMCPDRERGNVLAGLDHIPGGVLLALIGRTCGAAVPGLVASGSLVVTDARPAPAGSIKPWLPAPAAIHAPKVPAADERAKALNVLRADWTREDGAFVQTRSLGGLCLPVADDAVESLTWQGLAPDTHAAIDRLTQRPALNGVFTYEVIPAGTRLIGEILTRGEDLDPSLIAGRHRVGTATSSEYGCVEIAVYDLGYTGDSAHEPTDWPAGTTLSVWLTSDLVLPLGEATEEAAVAALESALGVPLTLKAASVSTVRRESWQARWGLPRPSVLALAAGSVLEVDPAESISGERLAAVAASGLGVRRAEGCGRVRFNEPLLGHSGFVGVTEVLATPGRASREDDRPTGPCADQADEAWVAHLRGVAVAQALDELALEIAMDTRARNAIYPRPSTEAQAGALRGVAEGLLTEGGLDRAGAWVKSINRSQTRKRKWNGAAAQLAQLESLLEDPIKTFESIDDDRLQAVLDAAGLSGAASDALAPYAAHALQSILLTCGSVARHGVTRPEQQELTG